MFSSAVARKELHICFRCEYYLLQAGHTQRVGPRRRISRTLTTTPSRDTASAVSRNVRQSASSTEPEEDYTSQDLPPGSSAPSARTQHTSVRNLLRLSTSAANVEQTPYRRSDVQSIRRPQLEDHRRGKVNSLEPASQETQRTREYAFPQERPKYPAFRHPDVASDRVELGVKRLGEPATIRVLPEKRERWQQRMEKRLKRHPKVEHDSPGPGQKQRRPQPKIQESKAFDDVVKTLDPKNQGAAGAAESMNNIENLRKAFLDGVNQFDGATQKECFGLAISLKQGFTTEQLRVYKNFAVSMKHSDGDKLDALFTTERYSVSRWYVGPSQWPRQSLERLDPKSAAFEQDNYAVLSRIGESKGISKQGPKHKLINNILRVCWGIRPREERLQEGSVSMKIGVAWLDLMLCQDEQVFYKASEMFKVKTEIAREHSLVRITGSYDACVDAVRMIGSTVSSASMEQINLFDTVSNKNVTMVQTKYLQNLVKSEQLWQEIEDQTFTKIELMDLKKDGHCRTIHVYHFPNDRRGLPGVRRRVLQLQKLLNAAFPSWMSVPTTLSTKPYLMPIANSPDMPLTERFLDWYRWKDRRPPDHSKVNTIAILGDVNSVFDELTQIWNKHFLHKIKEVGEGFTHHEHWNSIPHIQLTATLGQLVYTVPENKIKHLHKRTDFDDVKISKHATLQPLEDLARDVSRHRRTVIPTAPHLLSLVTASAQDESTLLNSFKITLIPRSISGGGACTIEQAPVLELNVEIDEINKTTKLQNVRLVGDPRGLDLALPRQAADVRFDTEIFATGSPQNVDPAIVKFLKESNLDVWGTGQFETPSMLTLTLPWRICQLISDKSLGIDATVSKKSNSESPESKEFGSEKSFASGTFAENTADTYKQSVKHKNPRHPSTTEISSIIQDVDGQDKQNHSLNASVNEVKHNQSTFLPGAASDLQAASSGEAYMERSTKRVDHQILPAIANESTVGEDFGKTEAGSRHKNREHVEIEYTFESLAIQSRLQTLYQGFPLSISTIEGGQVGGKREEVQLEIPGIADHLIKATIAGRKHGDNSHDCNMKSSKTTATGIKLERSYFTTFFQAIAELIGQLPKQ